MVDYSIPLIGSEFRIGMVNLDVEKKSAIFLLLYERKLIDAREIKEIERGILDYLKDFTLSIIDFGKGYIKLAHVEPGQSVQIRENEIGVMGYETIRIHKPVRGYVTFFGDALEIRKGEIVTIPDLNFYTLQYQENGLVSLFLSLSSEDGELEKELFHFNPVVAHGRYLLYEGLADFPWKIGDRKGGLLFDASGTGRITDPYNYVVYNDFFLESVTSSSIRLRPVMICKVAEGELVEIKGDKYLVSSIGEEFITFGPAFIRTLPDALPPTKRRVLEEDIQDILKEILRLRSKINENFRKIHEANIFLEDEGAAEWVSGSCKSEEDFTNKIGGINIFIDKINDQPLKKLLTDYPPNPGSINLLEHFLKKKYPGYDERIIENLRDLKSFRIKMPFHPENCEKVLEKHGFSAPYDWQDIWRKCLELYYESLSLLSRTADGFSE